MWPVRDEWNQHLDELNAKSYSRPLKVSTVRIEGPFRKPGNHIQHVHPYWQLEAVFGKSFSVTVDGETFTPKAGDILFIPPQCWHKFEFPKGKKAWTIKFALEGQEDRLPPGIARRTPEIRRATAALLAILEREERASRGQMVLMEHLIAALIDLHFEHLAVGGAEMELVRGVRRRIDKALLLGQDIRAQDIARETGVSLTYVTRVLKRQLGIPLKGLIDQRRFDAIREFLTHSTQSVGDVAAAFGFPDVFALSRFFKRMSGICPREYRKRHLPAERPAPGEPAATEPRTARGKRAAARR